MVISGTEYLKTYVFPESTSPVFISVSSFPSGSPGDGSR